jgi:hypothetical protein
MAGPLIQVKLKFFFYVEEIKFLKIFNFQNRFQGYCLSYEPGTEHEIECELPAPKVDSSLASSTYNNYEPSEQALDRSDGIEEQQRSVDETEFVSSRQNNQQQHATGSSSSLLSSRGVVSSWPILTLLLLAPVSFLHYI